MEWRDGQRNLLKFNKGKRRAVHQGRIVLGSSEQGRFGAPGAGPAEGNKDEWNTSLRRIG